MRWSTKKNCSTNITKIEFLVNHCGCLLGFAHLVGECFFYDWIIT